MIDVIAFIKVKAGKRPEFLTIVKSNIPDVRAENGCIAYAATVDLDADLPPQELDDNMVTIVEKWESLEALRGHLAAPHMQAYREKVKDMVENVSIKVLQAA